MSRPGCLVCFGLGDVCYVCPRSEEPPLPLSSTEVAAILYAVRAEMKGRKDSFVEIPAPEANALIDLGRSVLANPDMDEMEHHELWLSAAEGNGLPDDVRVSEEHDPVPNAVARRVVRELLIFEREA